MNKKIVETVSIITIIIAIIFSKMVYANTIANKKEENQFFSTDKKEYSKNEYVTMVLDLEQIEYSNFKFTLSADKEVLNNITENDDSKNTIAKVDGNQYTITGNKDEMSIEKIELYYKIPENIEVGSKIVLTATIENTEDNKNVQNVVSTSNFIENTNQIQNVQADKNEKDEMEIEITITEENNITNTTQNETTSTTHSNGTNNNLQPTQGNQSQSSMPSTSTRTSSSTSTTTVETYKGSSLNYLTSISVDGFELTPNFSLTNTTYFMTVGNEITSINVNTEKYDAASTVKIYGNTDLQVGQNKVLISVTAQNGNVRTYRIYVTREG